jgi:hypothetical protein
MVLAKLTANNQLTLPYDITQEIGETEYFEINLEDGKIILTPVKVNSADRVREKLAALELTEKDIADAVDWVRQL